MKLTINQLRRIIKEETASARGGAGRGKPGRNKPPYIMVLPKRGGEVGKFEKYAADAGLQKDVDYVLEPRGSNVRVTIKVPVDPDRAETRLLVKQYLDHRTEEGGTMEKQSREWAEPYNSPEYNELKEEYPALFDLILKSKYRNDFIFQLEEPGFNPLFTIAYFADRAVSKGR